ncbi:MAG TPA: DMT family transporter [Vicinamibacterales bacterium]|nr:DMT family transporter [Vicinamibacterales bacterium]
MTLPRLEVLVAAILFSTGGAVIKAVTMSAWQVACFRAGIAAVTLLLLVPDARRVSRRALVVGVVQAATFVTFVLANRLTTAASAVFLQATAPLWLILLGPLLLGERSRRGEAPFVVVLFLGVVLLMWGTPVPSATAPDTALGNVVGVVSGLMWALTLAGLRWAGREGAKGGSFTAPSATMWGNVMACVVCLPLALPVGAASAGDWILLLYLGVVQVGLAYVFLARGLGRIPAVEASLLLLLEPALSPYWAWLAHGEQPGLLSILGGATIVTATTWRSIRPSRGMRSSRGMRL